jgi:integrase
MAPKVAPAWIRSEKFSGVLYREHPTRRHGLQPDRYYAYRFQVGGKRHLEALGWSSEGWSEKKAFVEMQRLRDAARSGEGPASRKEQREEAAAKRQACEAAEEQRRREGVTLKEFFDASYYPAQEAEKATGQKSARAVRREEELFRIWVAPVIGDKPIKEIAPTDLERVKTAMLDAGRAPRTVEYALSTVRQIINHARVGGVFNGDNPVRGVKKPKSDNKRDRFLTEDEADRLLDALAKKSAQVHDMALLSLHCGLRAGEIFSLTWANVDAERETLAIRDTKSGHNRMAFMTQAVRDMFEARKRGEPSELVFLSETGGKIGQISQTFIKTVNALGFNTGKADRRDKVVFHTLRHTFASWLVQRGVDLYAVQRLMGHESQAMTQRYAHLAPDHLQAAVKILEKGMEKAGK